MRRCWRGIGWDEDSYKGVLPSDTHHAHASITVSKYTQIIKVAGENHGTFLFAVQNSFSDD